MDACSSIGIAINASLAYGLPSVILSLDLDNAYNSIDRSFVAEALINSEIDPNIVIFLMNHYNSANICFQNTSFNLGCKRGILQGDPTSSKIFAIAMDYLMKLMQKILPSFVSIDYRDDINIISKSPADAQASLDYLIPFNLQLFVIRLEKF